MRILFMGTPDFALFSLRAMVEAGENIIGVVTQPDKPKGRGYALLPPPVKVYATEQGLPVWQPATLRSDDFSALLSKLDPDNSEKFGKNEHRRNEEKPLPCGCKEGCRNGSSDYLGHHIA